MTFLLDSILSISLSTFSVDTSGQGLENNNLWQLLKSLETFFCSRLNLFVQVKLQ